MHPQRDDSMARTTDGGEPVSNLIQDSDGNFYGTASLAGISSTGNSCGLGCGVIFKLTATH